MRLESSSSSCVPAVIAAIDGLPTRRAELLVLEYLLRQRVTRGTSIEKLYAALLSQVMTEEHQLPSLKNYLPK